MELDLLRKRAEKIPNGWRSQYELDAEFRIFPDFKFTCNGHITSLLLGADIKKGIDFPEVHVWRNGGGDLYTRQASQEIRLKKGDFSPDGVLQYILICPLAFQSGDVLGVYQPRQSNSVVRLYYFNNDTAPVSYSTSSIPTTISLSSLSPVNGQVTLITPLTSEFNYYCRTCH